MTTYSEHVAMDDQTKTISSTNDECVLYCKENDVLITKNRSDHKRCNVNRISRSRTHIKSVVGSLRTVLVLPGIIGWLVWLTFMILENQTPQQHQKVPYSLSPHPGHGMIIQIQSKQQTSASAAGTGVDMISSFTGELDITSLFDEDSHTLRYLPTIRRVDMNSNVTQINEDGSLKILRTGRYLIHSKLALTNEFRRTKTYRQCILQANGESLECDQGSVSPRKKRTSHIIRFDYFEQNQVLKVIMTNKALVYRDPHYNKLEMVGFVPN